jgi:LEA14-like dessication related protein
MAHLASRILSVAAVAFVFACSKPQPPQLVPQEAQITSVDVAGFDMRVKLDALNPNAFALTVQSVAAHVVVSGNQDLGTVTSAQAFTLPASAHTVIDVPLKVKWKSVGALAVLAGSQQPVPYTIDGTAKIGGSNLNVDVPFKLQGTLSPQQLQQAGLKSLQAIPGLQGLPSIQGLPNLLPPK